MTPGEIVSIVSVITTLILVGWQLRGFQARQDATDARLESHERICSERYKRIEEAQEDHVDVSNERHAENRERLENIDSKIDQLLNARSWSRGN